MKKVQIILSFVAWLLITGLVANKLQMNFGIAPAVTVAMTLVVTVLCVVAARKRSMHTHVSGIDAEIWVREIIKRLWKDNMFLQRAFSEDEYVLGGAVVHIPQPGAAANVVKNRSVYPAVAVRRTDTDITYTLADYTTDPTHIPDVELATISYDKTTSIINDLFGYLIQTVADDELINWMQAIPAANIIKTTGAATAALESGQTGNRLAFTYQQLKAAQTVMNKANVRKDGRVALIEDNLFGQFLDSLAATPYKDFSREYDVKNGTVGHLFGFDIMTRSTVAMAAAGAGALSVNTLGQATAATDNVACLCYQEETVARALGTVKMYQRENDPLYYGNVFSTRLRMGGRRRRGDDLGVVAIVQAAG